ncbi:MAG: iron transporter [Deltaproteobacteria bacterium]|nr:iron transporter [Deltaproteobacteria bacterium]
MREGMVPIKKGLTGGFDKGWRGFLWMMKIIVPVSLLTSLLAWSGWMEELDFLLRPMMGMIGLPPMAALPLIIGMVGSIYGGIAAMVVLPFSPEQMTLMAIFLLMAHNMIQEGIVQANSGIHPLKATLFRIAAALITVMAVAPLLGSSAAAAPLQGGIAAEALPLIDVLKGWGLTTLRLSLSVFLIIMTILTLLEILKETGFIHPLVRILSPFLKLMGLDDRVGFLWMTAVIFGLTYGGAVIVEETRENSLTAEDLETLHLSIGINHSMVEDPLLFMVLGLSAFWLYVPRLITAILSVRLLRLYHRLSGPRG